MMFTGGLGYSMPGEGMAQELRRYVCRNTAGCSVDTLAEFYPVDREYEEMLQQICSN